MKSICLNLSTRPDRWQLAQQEFSRIGLKVERFEAVQNSNKVISFNASKVKVLKSITEQTFFFEDDVKFVNTSKWKEILDFKPLDFDMLYLGGNVLKPTNKRFNQYWWQCTETWTTHALIYSPNGAAKILDMWKDKSVIYDEFLRQNQQKLKAFICKPFLAIQRPDFSDLQGCPVNYTNIFKNAENNLL